MADTTISYALEERLLDELKKGENSAKKENLLSIEESKRKLELYITKCAVNINNN